MDFQKKNTKKKKRGGGFPSKYVFIYFIYETGNKLDS